MKPLPASKSISQWQTERASKFQRACERIQAAVASGRPIQQTIRRVARSLNRRPFRCEPARRLAVSAATMRRVWDDWRRGGEVPAAFALHFHPRPQFVPAPMLARFVQFCANHPQRSLAAAWKKFMARGGSFGRGRRSDRPLKISLFVLSQYFSAAMFYQMQGELKASQTAKANLAKLAFIATAKIHANSAERHSRRRVKRENTFEI